jgi:CubicO group peptidase (beta-lactamase class C family)
MLNHSWRVGLVMCAFAVLAASAPAVLASDPSRAITHQTSLGSDPGRPVTHPGMADIDEWVRRAMKAFEVPGLALTIVKDGQVVLAKGYGLKRLGEQTPVDARTLFGIASNTKAFTATALGVLVEEGKIRWDGRVIDYLPWFQMSDPYVTREMTVRDLLVHRSGLGLGAGDLLWWPPSTYDGHEIARRLREVPSELEDVRPNFYGYGLGFGVLDYRGKKLVSHTGGLKRPASRIPRP